MCNHCKTDDQEILELNEDLSHDLESIEVLNQNQNVVIYSILGLYNEDGSLRPLKEIKEAPPSLLIQSYDNEAEMLLTKEFTESLIQDLDLVKKSYYGIDGRKKEPWSLNRIKNSIIKNPWGFIFILLLIFLLGLNLLKIA